MDERFLTKKPRYTFLDCFKPDENSGSQLYQGLNALARLDAEKKDIEFFLPGPGCLVQEPAFSPRSPDAPEGDGFLITMVDNMTLRRNEVVILSHRLNGILADTNIDHSGHTQLPGSRGEDHIAIP